MKGPRKTTFNFSNVCRAHLRLPQLLAFFCIRPTIWHELELISVFSTAMSYYRYHIKLTRTISLVWSLMRRLPASPVTGNGSLPSPSLLVCGAQTIPRAELQTSCHN